MSFYKKIDVRAKILFILMFTLLVFLVDRLLTAVCLLFFFIIIRLAAKIPFLRLWHLMNLTLLAVFVMLIQTLFGPGENFIITPLFPPSFPLLGGMGSLKWDGFFLGLMISCRLFALMIILPVFTETSPPHQIAAGLSALGLNYRTAFIITSAFNMVLCFKERALVVMDAQRLRGVRSFGIKAYVGLAVPLLLDAMRKAQISSVSMDARSFGVYRTRTWLDKPRMQKRDFVFIASSAAFFIIFLVFNYT